MEQIDVGHSGEVGGLRRGGLLWDGDGWSGGHGRGLGSRTEKCWRDQTAAELGGLVVRQRIKKTTWAKREAVSSRCILDCKVTVFTLDGDFERPRWFSLDHSPRSQVPGRYAAASIGFKGHRGRRSWMLETVTKSRR